MVLRCCSWAYTAREKKIDFFQLLLRWTILILYMPFAEREFGQASARNKFQHAFPEEMEAEGVRRNFLLPFPEEVEAERARRNHERDQQARRIQEEINHLQLKLQTSLYKERERARSNIQSNGW